MPSVKIRIPAEQQHSFVRMLNLGDAAAEKIWAALASSPLVSVDFQPAAESLDEVIKQRFYRLAQSWREETAHLSSMTKMVLHPKYQSIIGLAKSR